MKRSYFAFYLIIVVVAVSLTSCDSVVNDQVFDAIANGDAEELDALLKMRFDSNILNEEGKTPLILAIESQDYELVRTLLVNEVDVNYSPASLNGETPLSIAIRKGTPEMVQGLIVYGAVPSAPDGGSVVTLAKELGRLEISTILTSMGVQ